jgi:hypothetical protein
VTIRERCPEVETALAAQVEAALQILLPRFQGLTVTETHVDELLEKPGRGRRDPAAYPFGAMGRSGGGQTIRRSKSLPVRWWTERATRCGGCCGERPGTDCMAPLRAA